MNIKKYLKRIIILRPLLFLCGPQIKIEELSNTETRDRRALLYQYIQKHFKQKPYIGLPIIVDEIFNDPIVTSEHLKISTLEEITASISYMTYIYLDSMSAGYEFGQFTNSKEKNNVSILLEKNYKSRTKKDIGVYAQNAIAASTRLIEYTAKRDPKTEYISFRGKRLAIEIQRKVNEDINNFLNGNQYIDLTFIKGERKEECIHKEITYYKLKNKLIFNINMRTMFYLMAWAFQDKSISTRITKDNPIPGYDIPIIQNLIESALLKSLVIQEKEYKLLTDNIEPQIIIDNYKDGDTNNIFIHLYYFLFLIHKFLSKSKNKEALTIKVDSEYKTLDVFDKETPNFQNIFGLSNSQYYALIDYDKNKDDYVHKVILNIHNKKRKIITYNDSYNGRLLREAHELINDGLYNILPISNSTYAYKRNTSTLSCVEKHLNNSNFIKLDISKYFDNIRKGILNTKIKKELNRNDIFSITYMSGYKVIFNSLFYKRGKLPIGFVTSPVLANFYLYEMDEIMETIFSHIQYTRYADDILLSGDLDEIKDAKQFIMQELECYKLKLNNKSIERTIRKTGDSIKFLGINIYRNKSNINEIGISKSYLIKASKKIVNYLNKYKVGQQTIDDFNKANGLATYIYNVSRKSFDKLNKMVKAKTGLEIKIPIFR